MEISGQFFNFRVNLIKELRKGKKFRVLLHTSSGQAIKKIYNPKRKRVLERVCHLCMSFRSIMNDGKEEPTRRATWMLNIRSNHWI